MTRIHPTARPSAARRQRGAALIVSLILLMVLTVLAVSTMGTARQGLVMAGNAQLRENAFRLAQAGLDAVARGPERVGAGPCPAAAADPDVAVAELGGSYRTTVCYRGESPGSGNSYGRFPNYNYEVTSTGFTEAREARTALVQGIALTGASGR